jgi:hypothetical protein
MTTIINGSSPSITFSDSTTQSTAADKGPAFSAYLTSNQTLSATTWTKVQCGIEEFDTASCYDKDTNYRFTPNVAGYYQVNGNVQTSSASSLTCSIYKNGSEFKRGINLTTGSATLYTTGAGVSALIYLNGTTDYIEMYAYTNNSSGGANVLVGNSALVCYFQASMVRAA